MKYFVSIFFLFCLSCLSAQEKHFVFIQTDNNLPFYVSLKGKLYSSSASGYMIIPQLEDGNYSFSAGFAKNAFPEQGFELVIDKKDLGFNLKNFGEKGWGLFNLQTMNVTMAGSNTPDEVTKAINEKERQKDDSEPLISFDKKSKEALAKAKKDAGKPKMEQPIADDKPKEQSAAPVESETREDNSTPAVTDVKKVSESKDEDGVHLSFADNYGSSTDTIQVTIPSAKSSSGAENSVSTEETNNSAAETNNPNNQTDNADNNATANSAASQNNEAARDSLRVSDTNIDKLKKDTVETVTNNNNAVLANSHCNNLATDEDFFRLRRKMAMQASDEKMIKEARKAYRDKCFTTSQIKRLSTLFLSDEGRYNFINVSYNSASDVSAYSTLQSEFIDPAFVSRFKAMLQ